MLKKFLNKLSVAAASLFASAPAVAADEAGHLADRFHYARPLKGFRLAPSGKHSFAGKRRSFGRTYGPGSPDCEARIRRLIQEGETHEAAKLFDEHVRYTPFNQVPRTLREWQVNYKVEQTFGKEESHV